jgi:arylsulfatase A-like enzyme
VSPSDRGNKKTRKIVPIKNTKHLNNTIYTLPEMLKSAGYITASFGKWHVGDNPLKQGIDFNVGGSSKGNPGKGGYFSPYNIDFIKDGPKGEYLTDRLTDEAISFIEKNKESSFFVYLPYYTVHTPLMGKEKLVEKFKNKKGIKGQNNPKYAAMVSSMDENIGKLLASIKANNLEKNTLVIFTSDNGGIRGISHQDPLRAGKGSYYEGGIRVPLIIKWPDSIVPNTVTNQSASNLDFYPTLQNIVQPEKRATLLDGIDLNPTFKKAKIKNRDLFFHFPIYLQKYSKGNDGSRDPLFRTRPGSVIISGNWKLHHYFEDDALELYNLENDLGEKNNLATSNPQKADELFKKLETWRLKTNAPIPTEKNSYYSSEFERQQKMNIKKKHLKKK